MSAIENIIQQLERQRTAIDNAIDALRGVGGQPSAPKRGRPKGSGGRSSVDGRERQADAMRAYWATKKASGKKVQKKAAKRVLTAAGRKALSANMKRMWAKKRAVAKKGR